LDMMRKIKEVFNSEGRFNPGKVLPTAKMCGELRAGQMVAGGLL
jgi:hypothetical protein